MFTPPPVIMRRLLSAILIIAIVLLADIDTASAHTGFESSSPADGDSLSEPVSTITITFSGEASPTGEGFLVLGPDGTLRIPQSIASTDNLTWTFRFEEPLVNGIVGVRWSVAAPDAHPIDGSFSFTVNASIPSSSTTTLATNSAGSESTELGATEPGATETDSTTENPPSLVEEGAPGDATTNSDPQPSTTDTTTVEQVDLDDFLSTTENEASGARFIAGAGRVLSVLGAVGAVGGTVFAAFVLRGNLTDIRAVLAWIRLAGMALAIGALVQAAMQLAVVDQAWSGLWSTSTAEDVLWSSFGASIALRFIGGLTVFFGSHLPSDIKSIARASPANARDHAWPAPKNLVSFVGIGLVALSFVFDGHTVSEGPRWLHAGANLVHVLSAATWAGGVVMLAFVMARRHRRGADTRALELGIRFSVVAMVALVAASLAGAILTVIIIDSVSQIWTTSWGRLLLLKVGFVAIAAACGGYNHRVLIPQLQQKPDSPMAGNRFRTVVAVEAIAIVAITVATGLLIGASAT